VKASGKRTVVPKTKEEEESLRAVINDITIFRDLDEGQVRRLMDAMTQRKVRAGEVVISQGEVGDFFYAVQSGRFAAKKGEEVKFVYDGSGKNDQFLFAYVIIPNSCLHSSFA